MTAVRYGYECGKWKIQEGERKRKGESNGIKGKGWKEIVNTIHFAITIRANQSLYFDIVMLSIIRSLGSISLHFV